MTVVDCAVRINPPDDADVARHLPGGWRQFLSKPNAIARGTSATPLYQTRPFRHPDGDLLIDAGNGSDPRLLSQQHLDRHGVSRALLLHDRARLAATNPTPRLSEAIVQATNDWMTERWLGGGDDRLLGSILVPTQLPDAAAEVRRAGAHPRVAAVQMGGNAIGKPFGHPLYHGVYEAAHDLGLVVVIEAGCDASVDTLSSHSAASPPTSYTEYHVLATQSLQTHMVSLIAQGVFERFPRLRVLFIGGGLTWATPQVWKLDAEYHSMRRDAPYLRRLPSEYFAEHVRVGTSPIEATSSPHIMQRYLEAYPALRQVLCYASDFPSWFASEPQAVAATLPPTWVDDVLSKNGDALLQRREMEVTS